MKLIHSHRLGGGGTSSGQALRQPKPGERVPAVALVYDADVIFDSDATLRGFATKILQSRWPAIQLDPSAPVEARMGFAGSDDQARTELRRLLQRAMATAGARSAQYDVVSFTARSEMPPIKVWCMAPIKR